MYGKRMMELKQNQKHTIRRLCGGESSCHRATTAGKKRMPAEGHSVSRNSPSCASLAGLRRVPSQQTSSRISLSHLGLLLRGGRIVILPPLREKLLDRIHSGHQGITKCRELARQSVWWPGLSKRLEELVHNCQECLKAQRQHSQPLTPTPLPQLPWQKVASDLFEWKQTVYLATRGRLLFSVH